jgi:hypothetical protein
MCVVQLFECDVHSSLLCFHCPVCLRTLVLLMYVCMHACMYYVCMDVCMYVCIMYVCMYVYIMHVCIMYVCMYYICMYVLCMYVWMYVCMYICVYVCMNEWINPLNPELNPICYLLALLGAHHFLHISRIRDKLLTFRLLMSYIYGAPILDVSRSHTTTHHSR